MAKGSQLSQLKSALSQAGITRQEAPNKKRKRTDPSAKLQAIHERLNPFDIKVTKLKHDVGGRKIRGATGRPAKSKQTGLDQRKRTLLKEYEDKNRVGGILDRRFGENDPTMTPEERMLERFTKERQRVSHGAAFNLEDDDELTHYGQSLSQLDDFDGTGLALDDEDEEEGPGHIDSRTVKSVHFGGFEDEEQSDEDEEPERKKSKAEVMAEVMAKSKEHKAFRQMSRQQDDDLRHQLDNELDSIRDLLFADDPSALIPLEAATLGEQPDTSPLAGPSRLGDSSASHPSLSSKDRVFDQYVHELAFDKRAKPKDRTKTEEELALEEKQRLEKAERRRVRRMEGLDDYDSEEEETAAKAARAQARGGDDLDDDFMGDEDTLGLGQGLMEQGAEEPRESIEGSEDEDDEDDEGSDGPAEEDSEIEGSEELSNDAASEGEDLDMEEGEHERLVSAKPRPVKRVPRDKELPYTFECPESHEEFLEIIDGVRDSDVSVVVQRIRTLYHPSLAEDNKFKLQTLTTIIIDHILYTTTPPSPKFNVVSGLLPHLTALTRAYPTASATHFMTKLKLMEKNLKHGLSRGALDPESKTFPGLPELALLRSVGLIWSTSDMNHVVVSPTRLLMAAYLGLGRVRSLQDLASGLFVCTLWVQYEDLSTRFVPEAINFVINAILHLAPHKYEQAADVPGCFPHPDFSSELTKPLRIKSGQAPADDMSSSLDIVSILSDVRNSKAANTRLLSTSFALLGRFADKYHALDGFPELFGPILSICKGLRSKKLPSALQDGLASLKTKLEDLVTTHLRTRQPLALQAHKPIPIPSYVPKFETSKSSYFKSQDPDREKNEAAKLRRQYKDEKKGAIRELRKDARFLAGVQQEQQRAKDEAYAGRMKRVFSSLEGERAEGKLMDKEKTKAKKRAGKR